MGGGDLIFRLCTPIFYYLFCRCFHLLFLHFICSACCYRNVKCSEGNCFYACSTSHSARCVEYKVVLANMSIGNEFSVASASFEISDDILSSAESVRHLNKP